MCKSIVRDLRKTPKNREISIFKILKIYQNHSVNFYASSKNSREAEFCKGLSVGYI